MRMFRHEVRELVRGILADVIRKKRGPLAAPLRHTLSEMDIEK